MGVDYPHIKNAKKRQSDRDAALSVMYQEMDISAANWRRVNCKPPKRGRSRHRKKEHS